MIKIQPKKHLNLNEIREERFNSMTIEELEALQNNYLNASLSVSDSSVISLICSVVKEIEVVIQNKKNELRIQKEHLQEI